MSQKKYSVVPDKNRKLSKIESMLFSFFHCRTHSERSKVVRKIIFLQNCPYDQTNFAFIVGSCNQTFTAPMFYAVGNGSSPHSAITADVNNDGIPDIIVANYEVNSVGILLNRGNGTFNAQVSYSTGYGSNPYSVAAADVNSDNKTDIVIADNTAGNVGVMLNAGNGIFNAPTIYTTGVLSYPRSVAVSDVNDDNQIDIIVANEFGSNIGVLLNEGDGTFSAQTTYSTGSGSEPWFVAVADVNGDYKPDIIAVNYNVNNVGVLLNTGNGTFGPQVTYPTGVVPYSVTAADVNGDGELDLIVPNNGDNNVGVLLNAGNGVFSAQRTYSTGYQSGPKCVAVADINGDNQNDIIVANNPTNNVGVLLNLGNGVFGAQTIYSTGSGSGPRSVATADLNGDSKPDIIVANESGNTVSVLLWSCD